jgi:hypothetical protein
MLRQKSQQLLERHPAVDVRHARRSVLVVR